MKLSTGSLVAVWAVLMTLLGLTIGASYLPLGAFQGAVNLGIAATKAMLILWFYMHLREESGLVRLAALSPVVWLLIMLGLMSLDYLIRA